MQPMGIQMQIRRVILAVFGALLIAPTANAQAWIEGLGSRPCSFVAENAGRAGFTDYLYEWISGYVSAYNTYAPHTGRTFFFNRELGRGETQKLVEMTIRHCRHADRQLVAFAVQQLIHDLTDER